MNIQSAVCDQMNWWLLSSGAAEKEQNRRWLMHLKLKWTRLSKNNTLLSSFMITKEFSVFTHHFNIGYYSCCVVLKLVTLPSKLSSSSCSLFESNREGEFFTYEWGITSVYIWRRGVDCSGCVDVGLRNPRDQASFLAFSFHWHLPDVRAVNSWKILVKLSSPVSGIL